MSFQIETAYVKQFSSNVWHLAQQKGSLLSSLVRNEAQNAEAADYVAYFCGLDCYDKWKDQKSSDKS